MKKVLTIAGSDSGGGAGIQADLKTFAARGVWGMSALTAITAQNTLKVEAVFTLPANFVAAQIDCVMKDIGADAWKTGMLANAAIIKVLAQRAKHYKIKLLVVDPVMVAQSGDSLIVPNAQSILVSKLIPLAFVVTPNLAEAQALSGLTITTIGQMKQAAVIIHRLGTQHVVVKGGHLPGSKQAIDILYDGKKIVEFKAKRTNTRNTHGTGCTFASLIAAELAKGKTIYQAVKEAKIYLTNALKNNLNLHLGHGHGPVNPF